MRKLLRAIRLRPAGRHHAKRPAPYTPPIENRPADPAPPPARGRHARGPQEQQ